MYENENGLFVPQSLNILLYVCGNQNNADCVRLLVQFLVCQHCSVRGAAGRCAAPIVTRFRIVFSFRNQFGFL